LDELRPTAVLDCPVGTGRFFETYDDLNTEFVTGVDVSTEMLDLAAKKVAAPHGHAAT
jgi:ubiquinone/menaquinone biosynthesis C-methylase UbiE